MDYQDDQDDGKDTDKDDLKAIHKEALEDFKRCIEAERENREAGLDDLEFARLSKQWPQEVIDKRKREARPCMTFNRMPTFIRQVVNDGRANRPAIKPRPVDSQADVKTAEIIGGLIRNIEYTSDASIAYDTGLDFAASCGFGYWRVDVEYAYDDTFDKDILIRPIYNPFSVYGDWECVGADSSEWKRAFVIDALTKDDFEAKYKGKSKVNWESDQYKNMPDDWRDGEKIIVAEYWTRKEEPSTLLLLSDGRAVRQEWFDKPIEAPEGFLSIGEGLTNGAMLQMQGITVTEERETKTYKVCQYICNGAEVLEKNDWAGKYIPIVAEYGESINVEGKRVLKSLIRDAKDAQRNFNYWRTTTTELIALAPKTPFVGPVGAFDTDADKWARANTDSLPYVEYDVIDGAPPPQRQPFAGVPAGALQEALNASDDMKTIVGMFDASLGARSNETSGKAINARKIEADTGTFHFIDNQMRAIKHTGRIIIDLIPAVYNAERVVRIIGEDDKPQNVPVNRKIQGPDGKAQIFDLRVGKYDLEVDVGPGSATKREEAAYGMTELMRAVPQSAAIIGPRLAKAQDWPGAEEIAQEWEAMLKPGENPQTMQMQQAIQQLGAQLQQATQKLNDKSIDYQLEKRKLDIDAYAKETDRIKATAPAFDPEQVQALVMQTLQQILRSPDILPGGPTPQPEQPPQGGFFSPEQTPQ